MPFANSIVFEILFKQNRERSGEQVPLGWKVNEKFTNHFFSLLAIPPGVFGPEIPLRYAT